MLLPSLRRCANLNPVGSSVRLAWASARWLGVSSSAPPAVLSPPDAASLAVPLSPEAEAAALAGRGLGVPFPPSRPPLYQASPLNAVFTRYYWLFTAMGAFTPKARVGVASGAVFASIEERATSAVWWDSLGLPRTWIAEHSLLALHVWLFHNRWKVDYNVPERDFNGRRMQEEVFERLWEDTTLRIRNAGIAEVSVNKQLENVQRVTFDDFASYDAALRVSDEDDGMELAAALWKGVFREDEGADTAAVLRLADYVRREAVNVLLQPREDAYRGWITWGPAVGETPGDRLSSQRSMLEGEWRDALAPTGRLFFYHTTTHERRWEPPEGVGEGFYARRRFALQRYLEANPEHASRIPSLAPVKRREELGGGKSTMGTPIAALGGVGGADAAPAAAVFRQRVLEKSAERRAAATAAGGAGLLGALQAWWGRK